MKITTYGHCCLLIELENKRILTDPGAWSGGFEKLANLDLILITHEHGDHLHTDALAAVLEHNPSATVVCNESVGKILTEKSIAFVQYEHLEAGEEAGLALKAYEGEHAEIVGEYGKVQNTGFLLENGAFFYPGDAYTVPEEKVDVLAAPVAGPWCKVSEAIAYVLNVAPNIAIPVHDAVLNEQGKAATYAHFERELQKVGINFKMFQTDNTCYFK